MVVPLLIAGVRAAKGARGVVNARKVPGALSGKSSQNGVQNPEVFRRSVRTAKQRFGESQSLPARVNARMLKNTNTQYDDGSPSPATGRTAPGENGPASQVTSVRAGTSVRKSRRRPQQTPLPARAFAAMRKVRMLWTTAIFTGWCLFFAFLFFLAGFLLIALGSQEYVWGLVTIDTFLPVSSAGMLLVGIGIIPLMCAGVGAFFFVRSLKRHRHA